MGSILEMIRGLPIPFNMVVLIVLLFVGAGVITSLVEQARRYLSLRHELDFKREMIDRGMSAEEVERIVQARVPEHDESGSEAS